jgi:hypothetical protein
MTKPEPKGFFRTCWYYFKTANRGMSYRNPDINHNIGWLVLLGVGFAAIFTGMMSLVN